MKEIIFAVPGSKKFISQYYENSKKSFINFSITGNSCELNCRHCKSHLLKDMTNTISPSNLEEIVSLKYENGGLKGILISGGFDLNGKLPIKSYLDSIANIKKRFPGIKILAHLGFVEEEEAKEIKKSGIDYALVNLISSPDAIKNVYNLKNKNPQDYFNTIENLIKAKVEVVPHIVIGLDFLKIDWEFEAVERISEMKLKKLVFVLVKKLSSKINILNEFHYDTQLNYDDKLNNIRISNQNESNYKTDYNIDGSNHGTSEDLIDKKDNNYKKIAKLDYKKILELFHYSKKLMPHTQINLGCASLTSKEKGQFEIALANIGIDAIAFPSDDVIKYVISKKIPYSFKEVCCAAI